MCYRSLLILLIGIILVDMNSAQEHVTIEQTNGYNDTWTNISSTCSLLGVERMGNMWENKVIVENINDITGTGWISAHVERQGTLQFLGCEYGTVRADTPSLEVTHDRIAQCIYFCGSSETLLHRNYCYCSSNIIFDDHSSLCYASPCGNIKPLFCGQSEKQPTKQCMCRYKKHSTNVKSTMTAASCLYSNVANCILFERQYQWQMNCDDSCIFHWNGYVMRELFYWGTSSSVVGNQDYCVAIRKVNTNRRLTLITLPCSSKQTGICIKGTRISTTPQTTSQTTPQSTPQSTARTTNTDILTSRQSSSESVKHDQKTNITGPILSEVTTFQSLSESSADHQQTNILGPIIGGVVSFTVLVMVGVIIVGVLIKRHRRKADTRSKPPHELNIFSTSNQQNSYKNCATEHRGGREQIHAVDTGDYDSLENNMTDSDNTVYDLCDHTSEAGDNMYGRLNQGGSGTVSPENVNIYDHSRAVVQLNGDTYDSFQTGVSLEDCSADYYNHTHVGEDYGYLEKGGNRKGQADVIYDHSRGYDQSNGETYDSIQTGRYREDASEDCYDHTGVSAGYGYLEKGSKVTVLGDDDYSTVNVVKGNR